MGYKGLFLVLLVFGCANAQVQVCVPTTDPTRCDRMNIIGSQVSCAPTGTRVECGDRMGRGVAHVGRFTEEEVMVLAQMPINADLRVVASLRERDAPFAFEAVTVVRANHTGGLEGLRNSRYCHPGFSAADIRWSPRVRRALETAAARTDRCEDPGSRTAEEMEVQTLSNFFSEACRPGQWSANPTLDADLKQRFPNLCAMCTAPGVCAGYDMSNSINIQGSPNTNAHVQALECLRTNGTVAYVAWQHAAQYFRSRSPEEASGFALLCENGTLAPLTAEVLNGVTSPCAFVRQPWSAIVATAAQADSFLANLRDWWPGGASTGDGWEATLHQVLVGSNSVVFEDTPVTPLDYAGRARTIPSIDATRGCIPTRHWCTVSALEQNKCSWLRAAAYTLGLQPAISCQQRADEFQCLNETSANVVDFFALDTHFGYLARRSLLEQNKCSWLRAAAYTLGLQPAISCQQRADEFQCLNETSANVVDFFALDTHFGYLARRHYQLSAVKLVRNERGATSRVAAVIRESDAANYTRFGLLKDGVACFPEFGSLAYVAFLRAAHELRVISPSECNYARAVGEFFSGACAPGADHSTHSITDDSVHGADHSTQSVTDYSSTKPFFSGACAPGADHSTHSITDDSGFSSRSLCTACRTQPPSDNFTCAFDWTNAFFRNNGSMHCLRHDHTSVAFVELQNIDTQLRSLNLSASSFRVLCRNDELAPQAGFANIPESCLLTHVVDAEVLTRRNGPASNSISALLDALDQHFGYNAYVEPLVQLQLYRAFDSVRDLLFKDTTLGLTDPATTTEEVARNYIDLFTHLEACTSSASATTPGPGAGPSHASRNLVSMITLAAMGMLARFVVY